MKRTATILILLLLMFCTVAAQASGLNIRELDFLGLSLAMGEAEAKDQITGQGFELFNSGQDWYRYTKTSESGLEKTELRIYLTADKRIWKMIHSVIPQTRSRSRGPEPHYLELLERYGTPDEGGPETARSIWRESGEWGVPTLTIESRGGTASVLEWPALKKQAAGRS